MFVALERLLSLDEGYRRVFRVQERSLLLMVVRERTLLLENRCRHQGRSCTTPLWPVRRCVARATARSSIWPAGER